MKTTHEHAVVQLLNAFLDALGDKFVRKRKDCVWTPRTTAIALLILVLESTDKGYESLLSTLRALRSDLGAGDSHESTFSRARKKLTAALLAKAWAAMRSCMEDMLEDVHPGVCGYRLVAMDGVWMNARRSQQLFRQLAKKKDRRKKKFTGQPQVLVVCLADVLTRTPLAWEMVPAGGGEREAGLRLLKRLGPKTIVLADRGFPSRAMLECLNASGHKFILRVSTAKSAFREIKTACAHRSKDRDVTMKLTKWRQMPQATFRLVRGYPEFKPARKKTTDKKKVKKPQEWALLTNLPRNARWTRSTIMKLYHERWAIETLFREIKQFAGANHFHAHSLHGLEVELCMTMVAATLMAASELIALTIRGRRMPRWNELLQKRCNRATLSTVILNLLKTNPETRDVTEMLDKELNLAQLRARPRRPGRSEPRICKSFVGKWKLKFGDKVA